MISSNKDAIRRDILLMLSQAKAWYQKSEKLGGGGRSFDQFTGFMDLGYESENEPAAANVFINENGTFVLEKVNDGILITGRLVSDPGKEVKYSLLVDPHSYEIRIEEASPAH
jgi:hypothetical protein